MDLQRDAARDGPIIVLIANKSSRVAIIIPHQHPPVHVRLSASMEKLVYLVTILHQTVNEGARPGDSQPKLIKVLRELWDDVVLWSKV